MNRRRRGAKRSGEFVTRQEFDEVLDELRRLRAQVPPYISLRQVPASGLLDEGYGFQFGGNADTADDSTTVGGYTPEEIPYLSDGSAPASSPTPIAQGGPRYFAVKWAAAANADLVTYEVHVSDTSGFSPDASTLAGETPGLAAFIRTLPDGSDFEYETDYFFRIVAKDEDGSAAAGAESAAEQLDPNGTDDLLAGSVTAEKLESVLAMASAFLAGAFGGSNVQMGFGVKDDGAGNPILDSGFIGVRAYSGDPDDTEPVFKLDATGGTALFRGKITFGSTSGVGSSRLTTNDMVQIREQSGASWMTPTLEQATAGVCGAFGALANFTSIDATWDTIPTDGNELVMMVAAYKETGAPTMGVDASWTQIDSSTFDGGNVRHQIYRKTASGESGTETITLTGGARVATMHLFEFSGVQDADIGTPNGSNSGTGSGAVDTGTTGTALTQDSLVLGALHVRGDWVNSRGNVDDPNLTGFSAGWTQIADTEASDGAFGLSGGNQLETWVRMKVASSGTHSLGATANADVDAWGGAVCALKAKANAVEDAEAETVRLYAKDVGGESLLHSVDEVGNQRSLVLGKQGERWDLEIVAVQVNINGGGAISAHSGGSTVKTGISGLLVGDKVMLMGRDDGNNYLRVEVDPDVTVAGQVTFRYMNADSVSRTPGNTDFQLLVIHRSV